MLRECGQEPLQFYWFRAAVRFHRTLLCSNSGTLAKVLKADIAMSTVNKKCWSAEFLDASQGRERRGDFQRRVRALQTIPQSEFVVEVRKRLRSIWSQANQLGNEDQTDKAAKCHNRVALPLRSVTVDGPPFSVPRYLHLDLGRQTQRNVARFRLHSHTLRVKTRSWEHHDGTCDKCGLQAIQDEKHALFLCPYMQMCSLKLQFADLFRDLPLAHVTVNQTGAFYFSHWQACSEDVFNFPQRAHGCFCGSSTTTSSAPSLASQTGLETLSAKQEPKAWPCLCMSAWNAVHRFQITALPAFRWLRLQARLASAELPSLGQVQLCNLTLLRPSMDVFCYAVHQQPEQSDYLAEGQILNLSTSS